MAKITLSDYSPEGFTLGLTGATAVRIDRELALALGTHILHFAKCNAYPSCHETYNALSAAYEEAIEPDVSKLPALKFYRETCETQNNFNELVRAVKLIGSILTGVLRR